MLQPAGQYRFVKEIRDVKEPTQVLAAVDHVARPYNLEVFGAWFLPRRSTEAQHWGKEAIGKRIFYAAGYDGAKHIEEYRTYSADKWGPSQLTCLARRTSYPFTLIEARRLLRPTGRATWVWDFLRRRGVRDGLYCPFRCWVLLYRHRSPKTLRLDDETRALLFTVAAVAVGRIGKIVSRRRDQSDLLLTSRQVTILQYLADGLTQKDIAAVLRIKVRTVRFHVRAAFKKLEVKTTAAAIAAALRQHLIT